MKRMSERFLSEMLCRFVVAAACGLLLIGMALAQAVPYARKYAKSHEEVEAALKELQAYSGQKLPIADGFVAAADKPLERFERAFYQFSIELIPGSPGGTIVQVTAKITAWYLDRDPAKSGYQVLASNGRLELDLLDRLEEKLGGKPSGSLTRSVTNSKITAPKPKLDLGGASGTVIPPFPGAADSASAARTTDVGALRAKREAEEKRMQELNEELQSLLEIQKHQAHPSNLVAVKKSGTPVLTKPAEGAHVLFNAAADDEFEFIDPEGDWIHVQISGPSRGYIRRGNLELPELLAARLDAANSKAAEVKPVAFRIVREESGVFPGGWEALKGKTVKIYTVQPASPDPRDTGARAKLDFARALFQKSAAETTTAAVDGVVVIFDSADGGILGATLASVKEFAAGTLPAENFWKLCYKDPPEVFQDTRKP
jgi:hypothetical protein